VPPRAGPAALQPRYVLAAILLGRGLAPLQVCLHAGLPLRSARCILPWPPGQFGLQIPLQSVGGTLLPFADLPCDLGLEGMALRGRLGPSSLFARATQAYSSCLALATGLSADIAARAGAHGVRLGVGARASGARANGMCS
jgi:hypothetical protein